MCSQQRRWGLAVLVLLSFATPPRQADAQGVVQVIPSIHASRTPGAFLEACLNMSAWPTVLGNTTYLGASDHGLDPAADGDLQNCFAQMASRGLQLTIETGALKGGCLTGEQCFAVNYGKFGRFRTLGGSVFTVLRMDEPLKEVWFDTAFGANYRNMSYAVRETVDWIQLVRSNYPTMQIVDIEPYPALSAAFLVDWINALEAECAARNVACPDVFEVDWDISSQNPPWNPYDLHFTLKSAAHNAGMAYSMIYTNDMASANSSNPCDFDSAILNRAVSSMYGGFKLDSDWYTFESWDPNPAVTIPEIGAGCTFMEAVKRFMDEEWYLRPRYTISLRAYDGGQYVSKSADLLWATATVIGNYETFTLIDLNGGDLRGGDPVRIRFGGDEYMFAQGGGGSCCYTPVLHWTNISADWVWETFTIINLDNPSGTVFSGTMVALQSSGGYYVCAEGGGNDVLHINRPSIGGWEKFFLIR